MVNQIASIDYYPTAGQEFYVDDICLEYTAPQLDPLNAQLLNVTTLSGLAGQDRNPSLEVRNFGLNDINSFDVTFDYSGTQITENVSGLNLTSMQSYTVDFANTITKSAVEILKTKEKDVIVVFNENPKGNWFLAGEQL